MKLWACGVVGMARGTEDAKALVRIESGPQNGAVAQLVEHGPEEPGVSGSIPLGSAKFMVYRWILFHTTNYLCKKEIYGMLL